MQKEIKNILFDLGGVIFHINYQKTIIAFKKLGMNDFEKHFTQHKQKDFFNDFETGIINSDVFVNTLQKNLSNCSDKKIINAWNAMLLGLPIENLNLLRSLKKKYRLFLLSNTNDIHINSINNYLKKEYGFSSIKSFFEKAYYSQEIGKRKPDVSTFGWVLNDAKIKARETLFIDDSAQHIVGAKKAGLQTCHIKSNSEIISLFPDTTL